MKILSQYEKRYTRLELQIFFITDTISKRIRHMWKQSYTKNATSDIEECI